jgi:hypothetical protein
MADLRAVARAKAKKYGLDPGVFERQIQQESGFNPNIRSPAGALGVAQIMPATARGWGVNPLNPSQALDAAARNMARYVQQFGSYEKALRAYNAGPGNVERSKSFAETNNYVRTILGGGGGGSAPRLLTTKRTVPGALIAGAAGMSLTTPGISFDAKGYDEARRKSILGEMIAKRNPNSILLRSGLLTTVEPSTSDFTNRRRARRGSRAWAATASPPRRAPRHRLVGGGGGSHKIVRVDGKPVLGWLAQAVAYARANGWRGTVTSGVRTPSEQIGAASRFGLQHYGPAGPLGSNHVTGHDGAIDVTDPSGFERALRGYRGKKPIRRMRDDPVHFSARSLMRCIGAECESHDFPVSEH